MEIERRSHAAVLAILAAIGFGSSTVFGKRLVGKLDASLTTGMRFLVTACLVGVWIFTAGDLSGVFSIEELQWSIFGFIAVTSGGLALWLYYNGLSRVPASQATILELAWPVSAVGLERLVHGSSLSYVQ